KGAFNRALGRDLNTPVDLAEMREPAGTPDLDFLSQVALQRRSELVQLHCEAMSYQNQASSIRSSYLPQLNLLGASTYEENRYQVNPQITSLSVNCQWDFFDSGRRSFQAMNLEDQAVAAERERADKQSVISLQVYKAWLDLKSRREQVVVAQSALKASDENVRVTRARYNQGTGTNTEVLDAETLREQAYRNYFASVYSSLVSYMALQRAAGVL
ncbi:MAG TPA: TolC family protein, partial [Pirellulales bacterium]|nr:TolC family protein [Pirellulales bacterium]